MSTGALQNRYSHGMLKQIATFGAGTVVWWKDGQLTDTPQKEGQAYVVWQGALKPIK